MRPAIVLACLCIAPLAAAACGGASPSAGGRLGAGPADGGSSSGSSSGSGGGSGSGSSSSGGGSSSGGSSSGGSSSGGSSSGGSSSGGSSSSSGGSSSGSSSGGVDGGTPCYSESYDPHAKLDDLGTAYASAAWLTSSIEAMHRRYPTGYFVLSAEQGDSQLPGFADPSSWSALMESLMTMVHEESHGWDFDHAQGTTHPYVLTDATQIAVPQLTTWPRSEIVAQLPGDGSTQSYDQTYLTGEQGTYDAVFLFEELNAYNNGLAAITAVADQVTQQISARDGVAAHLLYLELYLRVGRTAHASDYAALKADPSWMKLVRTEWARAHFWDAQAQPDPTLDIGTEAILTHVNEPANLDEIRQFTGDPADVVACHP